MKTKINQFPKAPTLPQVAKDVANLNEAMKTVGQHYEECRRFSAISTAKCYASNQALADMLVLKQIFSDADKEFYLLQSLRNFHQATLDDIRDTLKQLDAQGDTREHIRKGIEGELEYNEAIVDYIDSKAEVIGKGELKFNEFIKELSDHLNDKFKL